MNTTNTVIDGPKVKTISTLCVRKRVSFKSDLSSALVVDALSFVFISNESKPVIMLIRNCLIRNTDVCLHCFPSPTIEPASMGTRSGRHNVFDSGETVTTGVATIVQARNQERF